MFRLSFKKLSIKGKILWSYLGLLIISLLSASLFIYFKSAAMLEEQSEQQFLTVTQFANQQFDQYFRDIDNLSLNILENAKLQMMLRQPYKSPQEWTTQDIQHENEVVSFLNGIYKLKPGISSILIYGLNGHHYYYHPVRRWVDSYDASQESWYEQTMKSEGRWLLSGRREERQLYSTLIPAAEEVVTFSRLIRSVDGFEPLGIMVIDIRLDMLHKLAGLDYTDTLLITDREGAVIVAGDPVSDEEQHIRVSTASLYTGWTSTYYAPKSELFRGSQQIRNYIILLTAGLFALAIILANLLSSGIVKPLLRLKEKMKGVEKGEFSKAELPVSHDEVGVLTMGYNRMVSRVEQLVEEVRLQEKQKLRTELAALQARINPHFMYNTLNGIRWIAMMDGNARVTQMIESLVFVLQASAKHTEPLIPVYKEAEVLQHYVKLMQMRNDQFDFHLEVAPELAQEPMIPFLLQPLVENAIFHGIIPLETRGDIHVTLYREAGHNVAVIRDNGVGMSAEQLADLLDAGSLSEHGTGQLNKIGVRNVYDRLQLQYGQQAELQVSSVPGAGTEIRMLWPSAASEGGEWLV